MSPSSGEARSGAEAERKATKRLAGNKQRAHANGTKVRAPSVSTEEIIARYQYQYCAKRKEECARSAKGGLGAIPRPPQNRPGFPSAPKRARSELGHGPEPEGNLQHSLARELVSAQRVSLARKL